MALTDTVTGPSATDAPAVDLTADLADAIREAERRIATAEFIRSELDRAEGYTYLAQCVQAIMQLAWARDHSHPYFVTATGRGRRWASTIPTRCTGAPISSPTGTT